MKKSPPPRPPVRGGPRKEIVPDTLARRIAVAAASPDPNAVARVVGQASQTPCKHNRVVSEAMFEVVIQRVSAGELLRSVCADLGISSGLVRKRAYDNPETIGIRLREARAIMADELFDSMLEVADDLTLPVADRRLKIEVLERIAKAHNRGMYGDKVQVDQRQVIINLGPDDYRLS